MSGARRTKPTPKVRSAMDPHGGYMRRWSIVLLGLFFSAAMIGCGPPQPAPVVSSQESDDICVPISEGPPPVCPEGCKWNGKECTRRQGIMMVDARPDAGPPPAE